MTELGDLYQEIILDHSKKPRNFRRPETVDRKADHTSRWAATLKVRRYKNIAVVAMANKMVRVAFALLKTGEIYRAESTPSATSAFNPFKLGPKANERQRLNGELPTN